MKKKDKQKMIAEDNHAGRNSLDKGFMNKPEDMDADLIPIDDDEAWEALKDLRKKAIYDLILKPSEGGFRVGRSNMIFYKNMKDTTYTAVVGISEPGHGGDAVEQVVAAAPDDFFTGVSELYVSGTGMTLEEFEKGTSCITKAADKEATLHIGMGGLDLADYAVMILMKKIITSHKKRGKENNDR